MIPATPKRIFRDSRIMRSVYSRARKRFLVGAVLITRAEDFASVGRFDERIFLYGEDRDLSSRYRQRRLPLSVTDAISAAHDVGGSSSGTSRQGLIEASVILGWLQMTANMSGRKKAALGWRAYLLTVGCIQSICVVLGLAGSRNNRFKTKAAELKLTSTSIHDLVNSGGRIGERTYFDDAIAVITGV
jgi:GT2 family glycosyltransferase